MPFHDILVETGGFGLYQKLLTFGALAFSLVAVSLTYWIQVFILLIPPHRCKVFPNDTEWINTLFNESNTQETDRCYITHENGTVLGCNHGMIYDFSVNYPTYVSEHDLVCENSWKVYVTHTAFWIGTIFGNIVFGVINDNYGRRRAYQCAVILSLVSDVATYFCEAHIPFVIARFFAATGDGSIATIAYVLTIEHSIPSKRRMAIFVWSLAYALSSFSMAWLIYALFNWRYILMTCWITTGGAIIMSYFLPESPSWLITKGRIDEAVEYIQRMGRVNGKPISKENILRHLQINNESNQKDHNTVKTISSKTEKAESKSEKTTMSFYKTFVTVSKLPNLRNRILCLSFLWLASCSCYNGNNLEFNYLPFNMYVTYSVGALSEIPGNIFVNLTLDRFGRRWTNAGFFIAGGIFGILAKTINSETLLLIFVMAMRTCYASSYDITFSFSSEVVPTEIRGRAISFIRTCGGLGGALSPFIVSLAQDDPLLPLALFGIISITAGLAMLTLPETAHQHLPQTMEDGENFGTKQPFWLCPFVRGDPEKGNEDLNENSIFGKLANPAFETDEEQVKCVRIQKLPKY